MAMDFPAPAAANDKFTDPGSGKAYTFDGVAWKIDAAAPPINGADYVLKAGDIMTGELELPTGAPSIPATAAHKKYVDETVASAALYQSTWQVAANIPDLNVPPNAPLNGYSWTAVTAVSTTAETAPASIPGIGGMSINSGDTVKWSTAANVYELIQVAGSGSGYLPLSGGTMTGPITMAAGANLSYGIKVATSAEDLTNHIEMYSGANGMGINTTSGGQFNLVTKHADHAFNFRTGAALRTKIDKNGLWCPGWVKANTGANGGFLIGDNWHGIVWDATANCEQYRSYQGKWEFRKTNGSLPGVLQTYIDGNTHGRVAGMAISSATVTPAVGALRPGCNIILYNDSIVTWHCAWESGFPTAESTWSTIVNGSGYSDFLRPSVKLEQWFAAPDSTGNATGVGLGYEIGTDGVVKVWKPKDGPDIKAGIVAQLSFVYPRKS